MDVLEEIIPLLKEADYLTVLTGAGVSTLSGLRDFRGKNGLYQEVDAHRIFDLSCFLSDPGFYYRHTHELIYSADIVKPSIVHSTLAALQRKGYVKRVITQNIDMLHQAAGTHDVIEIHGTPAVHRCLDCDQEFPFDGIAETVQAGKVPDCPDCGGIVKPDITFFGESLPEAAIAEAIEESRRSDCMLILGSTLLVQPAATLPLYALQHGGKIIIVNKGKTPLDRYASLRYDDLEEFFTFLSGALTSDLL